MADLTVGELRAELASVLAAMLSEYLAGSRAAGPAQDAAELPVTSRRKRAPLRPPLRVSRRAGEPRGSSDSMTEATAPSELDFEKARAALERMGLLPVKGRDG